MSEPTLTPDHLEEIARRSCDGILWTHGLPGRVSLSVEERDALVALAKRAIQHSWREVEPGIYVATHSTSVWAKTHENS